MYWVITSFSSVGYGDVYGHTQTEYEYQMFLQMIGIAMFGYMTGTFQTLLLDFKVKDQLAEQQEQIDHWIMQLDKAIN